MHFLYFFKFKKIDNTDKCVKIGITKGSNARDQIAFLNNHNYDNICQNSAYFRLKDI